MKVLNFSFRFFLLILTIFMSFSIFYYNNLPSAVVCEGIYEYDINNSGRGIRSPLDQFVIREWLSLNSPLLGNIKFSYTNIGLYLTISTFVAVVVSLLAINHNKITANE